MSLLQRNGLQVLYLIEEAADFRSADVHGGRAAWETDLERRKAGLHTSGCTSTRNCKCIISVHFAIASLPSVQSRDVND